jgi:ribosomal protein S18 acetylase RimI-like enzyme
MSGSFWKSKAFAGPTLWHALKSNFKSQNPERLAAEPQLFNGRVQRAEQADYAGVINFWQEHFADASGPRPSYNFNDLVHMEKILLIVRNPNVIGTIMARPLGNWTKGSTATNFRTYYIDMFCVAKSHRGTGLGSELLHAIYAALGNDYPSVFLKEGAPLSFTIPPFRSSHFTFRYVMPHEESAAIRLTPAQLRDRVAAAGNRYFINSRTATESAAFAYEDTVAVFSPAHQTHHDGRPLVWMTGFIMAKADPVALKHLSVAAARHFGTPWIWADGEAAPADDVWQYDGPYHLYAFNWNPGHFFNARPLLLL